MSDLLLDTCAVIWLAGGAAMAAKARDAIATERLHISPITAWELGGLQRKGRLAFNLPLEMWFQTTTAKMKASLPALSPALLIASQALPGQPPADPADRIVIATGREHRLTIVTRDRAILDYGRRGHVSVMEC